jgi:hypothetical protein
MKSLETLLFTICLAALAPITGFLAAWWSLYTVLSGRSVFAAALVGLLLGIVFDVAFLRRWILHPSTVRLAVWTAVYLFYSVGVFGFFMGVPVFNVLLGVPAGLLVGAKLAASGASPAERRAMARRTSLFTTAVLAVICAAAAALALADPYTAGNLEGMLALRFAVTQEMIVTLILAGGAGLLLAEYWLTKVTVNRRARMA